jgi:hypothetical protein
MELTDKGFGLIAGDIKRLKKFNSLTSDLENYFKIHNDSWKMYGNVSGVIASGKNYCIVKERVAIKSPKMCPSEGCRLWVVINTTTGDYYRCLLYSAKEEETYKKSICFNIVNEQIRSLFLNN